MSTKRYRKAGRVSMAILGLALFGIGSSLIFGQVPDPRGETPAVTDKDLDDLEARYAEAHLELAKLDLERAIAWNKRVPHLFSERTIDFLEKHLEIDQEQLRQAKQPGYGNVHQIYVQTAKAALDVAEADVARKQRTYARERDEFSARELDRAVAVLNLARINLERTMNQEDSAYSLSYLQWQVEELRNQLLELQIKVETTPER